MDWEQALYMLNGCVYHIDCVDMMMATARELYNWYDDDYNARQCKDADEFRRKYGDYNAIIWYEFVEGSNCLVCVNVAKIEDFFDYINKE